MLNIKEKYTYYAYIMLSILLCLVFYTNTEASEQKNKGALSKSERLLNVLKWDNLYKTERERDASYLLGKIDESNLQDLTIDQKEMITASLKNIVIEQMLKEKIYIKSYLMMQYNQFFTPDELSQLIQYFNTELMQVIINSRIAQTNLSADEIKSTIINGNADDKKTISSMTNSYLYTRYHRFQQKISPAVQKKIVNQLKTALSYAFDQIPLLIKNIKNNQKDNIQIDG